ncbi:MAG: hypothetical protein Q7S22_07600 [Candidatus Micrarchaeota archaeon]|nr:hypothetical protein [Candidatus Micrarchaeota archaeon]
MVAVLNQVHGKELLNVQVGGQSRNLLVLRGDGSTRLFEAHPLVDAFNAGHRTNLTVVSHRVADIALTVLETWKKLPTGFPVDALIAYEQPGNKLGREIVFSSEGEPRVILATGKFKGEKDVALVALGVRSADFKKDGSSIVLDIPDNQLIVVPYFPDSDGWYMPHAETGVPKGRDAGQDFDARFLYRLDNSSYVGFLVRDSEYGYRRQGVKGGVVIALHGASVELGVVAEVPDADITKIYSILHPD